MEGVLFHNNAGKSISGIHMMFYSTIIFGENSNVTFIQNLAIAKGASVT